MCTICIPYKNEICLNACSETSMPSRGTKLGPFVTSGSYNRDSYFNNLNSEV